MAKSLKLLARECALVVSNKYFRIRRGKVVQIPDEWVGQVPNPQAKKKRQRIREMRRQYPHSWYGCKYGQGEWIWVDGKKEFKPHGSRSRRIPAFQRAGRSTAKRLAIEEQLED